MPKIVTALIAAFALAGAFSTLARPAQAQSSARSSMEQCVDRVLSGLLRKRATDIEVGRAVVSQCDGQLKATLAEAIRKGEASSCTVEKCIQVARDEATREAREAYRARSQQAR